MIGEANYEVVDVEGRGKIVSATKDLLPGLELFRELPLLHVTKEYLKLFQGHGDETFAMYLSVFSTFTKLPEDKQKRYLDLYGPVNEAFPFPEICHRDAVTGEKRTLTAKETAVAVKVISISKYNAFGCIKEGPLRIYELSTRISHSCYPNCFMSYEDDYHICRTIRPIAAGDELTICYNDLHSDKPTHIRRQKYLTSKDFTCHCPRCDDLGDNTRQFNCFTATSSSTSKCPGVHLVCQPLNKEKVLVGLVGRMGVDGIEGVTEAHYTGVDYVEPYLLPCTVCACSPPSKYQQEMFTLEARLQSIVDKVVSSFNTTIRTEMNSTLSFVQRWKLWREFLHDVTSMGFPPRHILSKDILYIVVMVTSYITELDPNPANLPQNKDTHKRAVLDLAELIDRTYILPLSGDALQFVAGQVTRVVPTDEELLLGLGYIQRAVRMNSLRYGRVRSRNAEWEAILCDILEKLEARQALPPENLGLEQCCFCGESPQRAAIKLLRCARCLKVAYCSPGCQKAHWKKLHSKTCSKL